MQNRVYRFEILRPLQDGIYEARDDADQSIVTLYEAVPEASQRETTRRSMAEIAGKLECETFSAGASEWVVATTARQKSELLTQLNERGLLRAAYFTRAAPAVPPTAIPLAATPFAEVPVMAVPPAVAPVVEPAARKRYRGLTGLAVVLVLLAMVALIVMLFPPRQTVLRLEGSTTIGDELAPRLLIAFLNKKAARDIAEVGRPGATSHHDIQANLPGYWRPLLFSVTANGSGNAFKALAEQRADIGMSSRPIKEEEARSLESLGDMRSPCCESVMALDGLAVIVNNGSSIGELSRQQIGLIFRGSVSNWSQVGRRPGPIHLYGRKADSGTFDTFVALVLGGNKNAFAGGLKIEENGDEISKAVSLDPDGIGYVALAQVHATKALEVSDGPGTASLLPSPFTVATEDYILSRRLFFYAPSQATALAREFIDFAVGPEGQSVVESVGFVKQTPVFEEPSMSVAAPAEYRHRTAGLRRMSINFRFRPNLVTLDNKALADVLRAQATLFQGHVQDGVQVIGFADSNGSVKRNQQLSEERASVVAKRLRAYGIEVQVAGFSSAMPVGDNSTAEGREKNRRVEIWAR